jgi:hypothetical protein
MRFYALIGVIASIIPIISTATVEVIETESQLKALVHEDDPTVIMFHMDNQFLAMFDSISEERSDLNFASIDVTKENLNTVANKYNVHTFPTIALFNRGKQLKKNGSTVILSDIASADAVHDFINQYFSEDDDKYDRREYNDRYDDRIVVGYRYRPYYYHYPYWGYWYRQFYRPHYRYYRPHRHRPIHRVRRGLKDRGFRSGRFKGRSVHRDFGRHGGVRGSGRRR